MPFLVDFRWLDVASPFLAWRYDPAIDSSSAIAEIASFPFRCRLTKAAFSEAVNFLRDLVIGILLETDYVNPLHGNSTSY
jgi:hypothetical protein